MIAIILSQSRFIITMTSEVFTMIRLTNKPMSKDIPSTNIIPRYFPKMILCRKVDPANIWRRVPDSFSPQIVWVGLVILIPSLSRIITYKLHKIPSREEVDRSLIDCTEQFERDARAGKFGEPARHYGMDPVKSKAPWRAKWASAMTVSKNKIIETHLNAMIAQANAGRNVACISPAVIYQRACEAIAGTGINRFTSLHQQIKGYQTELKEYVRSKDSEDPKSLHLLFEYQGNFEVYWIAISKKPVDFNSVPKFQEKDLGLGKSLQLAIWDIGLLVLFNLVFFAAAFVSFLKYDVR